MKNFILIGAAGYIAPRHLKAIQDVQGNLLAAFDPFDSVGILDSFFPNADFFTEFERFDRHIEKLRRNGVPVHYVSICSPNYLHDAHIRFGLRIGANVICEKPVVLNPWNLDALAQLEQEYSGKISTILQLRLHPSVIRLKEKVENQANKEKFKIKLEYHTARGKWYQYSWKGNLAKSGGIATNIGIHFFDMLLWVFGAEQNNTVLEQTDKQASGRLELLNASVDWTLSIDYANIPEKIKDTGARTYRSLTIDGESFDFSHGFMDLHTLSYEQILSGNGFGLEESRASINLVHAIRNSGR